MYLSFPQKPLLSLQIRAESLMWFSDLSPCVHKHLCTYQWLKPSHGITASNLIFRYIIFPNYFFDKNAAVGLLMIVPFWIHLQTLLWTQKSWSGDVRFKNIACFQLSSKQIPSGCSPPWSPSTPCQFLELLTDSCLPPHPTKVLI